MKIFAYAFIAEETIYRSMSSLDQEKLPALIIFDKDGTLIDFQSTWTPWINALAQSLEADCDFDVSSRLYDIMGYCNTTATLSDSSLLAYASMDIIKEKIKTMLLENGVEDDAVDSLLRKCWKECHVNNTSRPLPTTDLPDLFGKLRDLKVKVAVCTSDSRVSTESALRKLKVLQLVDAIVCSDDENMEPKPSPHGVLKICTDLGVNLSDTIVVGDTTTDMLMAKSAEVGLIVGVLTGIGTKNELSAYADAILDNVEHIWTLFN